MEEVSVLNDTQVQVFIYDLSKGLAKLFSQPPLGEKRVNGMWHTSVVVFGSEFFFGKKGINSVKPCGTILGNPLEILKLGTTRYDYAEFEEFLAGLAETKYTSQSYQLFGNNCNKFTQEAVTFLTEKKIPEYLLILPKEVINTPLGESLKTLLEPVNLQAEGKFAKIDKFKGKEPKAVKDKEALKVIGEVQPSDTTEIQQSELKEGEMSAKLDENQKEVEEPKDCQPIANIDSESDAEILNESENVIDDMKEEKLELEFWDLNESIVALKRRQTAPLVINNIDDSKFPQLLCYFKRPTAKEE